MTDACYRCQADPCKCGDGVTLLQGDCLGVMSKLPEKQFHCCVTSPPYFALRSYLPDDHPDKPLEIGSETSIEAFVATMVKVFRGVWRVLRDDGVLFLNLGDSYDSGTSGPRKPSQTGAHGYWENPLIDKRITTAETKPKDLIGIPWRVALALQADGWYLRDAVVWHKPSPMPGSQQDRCTSSYEMVFQLTKRPRYFWDMEAVREPGSDERPFGKLSRQKACDESGDGRGGRFDAYRSPPGSTRIPRNVWRLEWTEEDVLALLDYLNTGPEHPNVFKITSEGYKDAHFATFPCALPEKCIKAATSEKGCCPECGAAWVRITDSERVRTRPGKNTKIKVPSGWARGDEPHDSMGLNTPEEKGQRRPAEEIGNRDPGRHVTATRTVGWRPGCECDGVPLIADPPKRPTEKKGETEEQFARRLAAYHAAHHEWVEQWGQLSPRYAPLATAPCRVLDPFGGAGTTGLAAIGLQRRCTLIELADDYCRQIDKRLRDGLHATKARQDDCPGQLPLFPNHGPRP